MENQTPNTPPVSALDLTHRQLNDWLLFRDQLTDANAPADQVAYCDAQIERLMTEISNLQTPPAQ